MKKYIFTFLVMACAATCFGQTTKQQLEKAKKDPKRVENTVKADNRLVNKRNIVDTTKLNTQIPKRKNLHKKVYRRPD